MHIFYALYWDSMHIFYALYWVKVPFLMITLILSAHKQLSGYIFSVSMF